MARPLKDGLDYFPHDTDAASDEKIEPLVVLYGAKGYAFYFYLLERIYRQKDFELLVSDAETIQLLTRKLQITEQEFGSMLQTSLRHGAFDKNAYEERQVLTSNGIKKRASVVVAKRESMRNRELLPQKHTNNPPNNMEKTPKVKERKVKESKEKKAYSEFVFMTEEEYGKLVERFGVAGTADKIENLNTWYGKNPTNRKKNPEAYYTILAWARKDAPTEPKAGINMRGYVEC